MTDLLGNVDAVDVFVDTGAAIATGLGDGQPVGRQIDSDVTFLVELFDELRRAGEHETAFGKVIQIHIVDGGEIHGIFAELFEQHPEAAGLEVITGELTAFERLPTPKIAGAVEADDLVGRIDAEMRERTADGGLFGEQEVIDGLVRVQQDDIVVFTQKACPPL